MTFAAAYSELRSFLSNYCLEDLFRNRDVDLILRRSFKKLYSILILERSFSRSQLFPEQPKSETFKLYFKETLSDILQALMIAIQGYYKPALLSLRSSLENFVRCIGIFENQAVLSLTSVYELMDVVKETRFIKNDNQATISFRQIKAEYATLCGYVHTSSAAHMALDTIVGNFPRISTADAHNFFGKLSNFSTHIVKFIVLMFPGIFNSLHHSQYDIVCDSMPPAFKRHINIDRTRG